jgi:hypothetical protein
MSIKYFAGNKSVSRKENGSQPLNSHFFKGLTHCECRNSLGFWENRKYNTTHRKTSH